MENIWSILCSKAIIDQRTSMVSLIEASDVIEGDFPELSQEDLTKPVQVGPVALQLASFWYRSDPDKPELGKARSILVGPNGKPLGTNQLEVDLESAPSRTAIWIIPSIPYVGVGYYYFMVEKNTDDDNWIVTAKLPLLLRRKTANQP